MKTGILRYYLLVLVITVSNGKGWAQDYSPVDKSSGIKFSIKNFGLPVSGSFTGLRGTLHFNPSDLPLSNFKVSEDANTVTTGMAARDNHLRKEEYLNVQKMLSPEELVQEINHCYSEFDKIITKHGIEKICKILI